MNKELKEKLEQFEKDNQATVLYVTKYGSKLYGTDNPNSDTDYKGVFVQNKDLVLLKKDMEHWTSNSNDTNEKNGAEDVDLQLFSVHKFFTLLRKGETGALDLLFSMWAKDTVVFENTVFVDHMQMYYKKFLNRKLHSFTGYAVGQAKKYGVKGTRYKELTQFNEWFGGMYNEYKDERLGSTFEAVKKFTEASGFKYVNVVQAQGPKTGPVDNMIDYLEVLGKKYSGDVTVGYFFERSVEMEEQFGNRAKSSAEGVDWKALSHSVRVLFEVEELLETGFVTFPLKEREFVTEVKEGKLPVDVVMLFVNEKLDVVKQKLDTNTTLPEASDRETMDWIELCMLDWFGNFDQDDDEV